MVINIKNCEFNISNDCYCHRVITSGEFWIPFMGGLLSGIFSGLGFAIMKNSLGLNYELFDFKFLNKITWWGGFLLLLLGRTIELVTYYVTTPLLVIPATILGIFIVIVSWDMITFFKHKENKQLKLKNTLNKYLIFLLCISGCITLVSNTPFPDPDSSDFVMENYINNRGLLAIGLTIIFTVTGVLYSVCCYSCGPNILHHFERLGIFDNDHVYHTWNLSENLKNYLKSIYGASFINALIRTFVHWITISFVYKDQNHKWPTTAIGWGIDIIIFITIFVSGLLVAVIVLIYALANCPLIFTVSIYCSVDIIVFILADSLLFSKFPAMFPDAVEQIIGLMIIFMSIILIFKQATSAQKSRSRTISSNTNASQELQLMISRKNRNQT